MSSVNICTYLTILNFNSKKNKGEFVVSIVVRVCMYQTQSSSSFVKSIKTKRRIRACKYLQKGEKLFICASLAPFLPALSGETWRIAVTRAVLPTFNYDDCEQV